jgi:TetR/AcrR family transcriptional repressor of nem operon
MRKGAATRERIMEIAEASVLAKGFGATSIEEIIAEAGITKSGFFYHFRDKNELAREMLRRFIDTNNRLFDELFGRGRELSDDPLQAFLISLKLLAETLADAQRSHPGCLIASICYQERLFDRQVVELARQFTIDWNARLRAYIEEIAALYPPRGVDPADLAETLSCVVDGGIILARILDDPGRLERQVLVYRSLVSLAFAPAAASLRPVRMARAA